MNDGRTASQVYADAERLPAALSDGPAPVITCGACGQRCVLVNAQPGFGQAAYAHTITSRCPGPSAPWSASRSEPGASGAPRTTPPS